MKFTYQEKTQPYNSEIFQQIKTINELKHPNFLQIYDKQINEFLVQKIAESDVESMDFMKFSNLYRIIQSTLFQFLQKQNNLLAKQKELVSELKEKKKKVFVIFNCQEQQNKNSQIAQNNEKIQSRINQKLRKVSELDERSKEVQIQLCNAAVYTCIFCENHLQFTKLADFEAHLDQIHKIKQLKKTKKDETQIPPTDDGNLKTLEQYSKTIQNQFEAFSNMIAKNIMNQQEKYSEHEVAMQQTFNEFVKFQEEKINSLTENSKNTQQNEQQFARTFSQAREILDTAKDIQLYQTSPFFGNKTQNNFGTSKLVKQISSKDINQSSQQKQIIKSLEQISSQKDKKQKELANSEESKSRKNSSVSSSQSSSQSDKSNKSKDKKKKKKKDQDKNDKTDKQDKKDKKDKKGKKDKKDKKDKKNKIKKPKSKSKISENNIQKEKEKFLVLGLQHKQSHISSSDSQNQIQILPQDQNSINDDTIQSQQNFAAILQNVSESGDHDEVSDIDEEETPTQSKKQNKPELNLLEDIKYLNLETQKAQQDENKQEKQEELKRQAMEHVGELQDDSSSDEGEEDNDIKFYATLKGKSKKQYLNNARKNYQEQIKLLQSQNQIGENEKVDVQNEIDKELFDVQTIHLVDLNKLDYDKLFSVFQEEKQRNSSFKKKSIFQ